MNTKKKTKPFFSNPENARKAGLKGWREERGIKITVLIKTVGKLQQATATIEGNEYQTTGADNKEVLKKLFHMLEEII